MRDASIEDVGPPDATPHGGESLLSFISRVGNWLETRPLEDGCRVVAVAEPSDEAASESEGEGAVS